MSLTTPTRAFRARRATAIFFQAASLAAAVLVIQASSAWATPLNFTVINVPSGGPQSKLTLAPTATLAGGVLTAAGQNANSLSTTYNDTASTDSKILANVNQQNIKFPGGSTAVANNTSGSLSPGLLGDSTTSAPGNYGVRFTSPQNIDIPPIAIQGSGTIDLGVLSAVGVDVALRGVVVDIVSGSVPLAPPGLTQPQSFAASQLQIGISGTADIALTATLTQPDFASFAVAAVALSSLQSSLADQGITFGITTNILAKSETIKFGLTSQIPQTLAANDDATTGTLAHIGSNYRLTTPVNFTVVPELPAEIASLLTLQFGLSGQLIGQAPYAPLEVPEPSSIVLGAIGASAVGLIGLRARRRRV